MNNPTAAAGGDLLDNLVLGQEVALSVLGILAEIIIELAMDADRSDLADKAGEALSMAADVFKAQSHH